MATLKEKSAEMARIKGELQRMETSEDTTEENDGDLRDTLIERWKQLDEETKPIIARMEQIRAITRTAADPANLERGAGYDGDGDGGYLGGSGPDTFFRSGRSPYEDLDAVRSRVVTRADLRARALDAIELEAKRGNMARDYAEAATLKAQDNPGIARHMLLTGSEEYQEAFRAYVEDPQGMAQRAALTLTLANGGYLLPFVLDPTIVLTNTGSANPWRRISNVKQTTSNTWNGVTSAGVNAAWLTEGSTVTDGSPTVGNIAITPQKAAAWVFGSYEVLEDTDFGQQLPRLLADAKDRLEEAAFATGAGSGGVPQGVITGATTVVTTATTLVVAVGDIYAVQGALPPRFRNAPGCAWVSNVAQINRTRQLDTAGGASFWTNLGKGQPETLLGAPIYESTTMDPALAIGTLLMAFGDYGQFYIVDRVGVSLVYEPLVKASGGNLPTGQAGWFMFWRVGSQVAVPNAFRIMKGK
ncbi:MAG TPA: phage major capsid protein [Trebonia sp.]|jgi:HK97 family phage major capsid protein|nr:phage major capsid protein [Trebonia sp.]